MNATVMPAKKSEYMDSNQAQSCGPTMYLTARVLFFELKIYYSLTSEATQAYSNLVSWGREESFATLIWQHLSRL